MCITFFRIASEEEDSEYPFLMAFNRDEVITRPAEKA